MEARGVDRRSQTLITWVFIFVLCSILLTYYRTMAVRDFPILETPIEEADSLE